ncbi:hypothetical protein ACQEU6_15620 [Spirillospora sp. CA-108201]
MRRTDRARALLAVAACAALAGCGIRPTGIISAGEGPTARAYAATITIYLVRGGRLVPVTRPGLPGESYLAVQQLTVPPTTGERALGLHTEVHGELYAQAAADGSGPARRGREIDVGPVGADGPKSWSRTAKAQIVCTAQAVPGTKRVNLLSRSDVEKHVLLLKRETLTCDDFSDLLG